VDRAVRRHLVRSLEGIYARVERFITYDKSVLQNLLNHIGGGPVQPAVFGTYTDFIESICADDASSSQRLSDQLLGLLAPCDSTRIVTLTDADLGPHQAQRYARLIDDDPEQSVQIKPITDKAPSISAITAALSLIQSSSPELADEIKALTREIVIVEAAECPRTGEIAQFDGASTFYLWGAVFVRVAEKSPIELAQTLAHETGHLLLFGLTLGRPLVENAYDERYTSPLREDPRPMEGLVHAAYVLSRMHYALDCLRGSGVLTADQRDKALSQLAAYCRSFFDTLAMIKNHARFTSHGASVFRGAVDYMTAAESRLPTFA
jgi:HEXXH motif-containing protein